MTKAIWWITAVLIVVGLVAAYYYRLESVERTAAQPEPPLELPVPQPAAEPPIRHPVPGSDTTAPESTPLPPLKESDRVMQDALVSLFGQKPVEDFLIPQNVIRRLVVTIDNLPRKKVAVEVRPVKPTPGLMITAGRGADAGRQTAAAVDEQERFTLSPSNYARYKPFIQLVQSADAKQIAALYFRFYPLFQHSYEDLGYPGRYFNDRLVETIDHLLDTPDVRGPIELVQPKVFYEFADPQLEARSAGQKLLIRMGSENAAIIKQKLRELRTEVAGRNGE